VGKNKNYDLTDPRVVFKRDHDENIKMQIDFTGKIAHRFSYENRIAIDPDQFFNRDHDRDL